MVMDPELTKPGISIIVPALNEAGNLESAVEGVKEALAGAGGAGGAGEKIPGGYEIIIFNDKSTDSTGEIAERLASGDPSIRVVHNPRTIGFGYNYTEGVRLARGQYVMLVPGDNEVPAGALKAILARVGIADMVVPYTVNPWVRPFSRRLLSRAFVVIINTLFGLKLRYYNGTCVHRTELLKMVPMKSWDFAYMAAILVRLIKSGATYVEVGVEIKQREAGSSKALHPGNVLSVLKTVATLFWDVRLRGRPLLLNTDRSPQGPHGGFP
jgi:glycosyltransferase involved in cell wall biosynthesis